MKKLITLIIIVLAIGDIFFGAKYLQARQNAQKSIIVTNASNLNTKILDFTALFIKEVLEANKEVSFETRLSLETKVRDLNDKEILAQWQKFTDSNNEVTAQDNVKKLLEMLVSKIKK